MVEAYKGQTTLIQYTSNAEDANFTLRDSCTDLELFGRNIWLAGESGEVGRG